MSLLGGSETWKSRRIGEKARSHLRRCQWRRFVRREVITAEGDRVPQPGEGLPTGLCEPHSRNEALASRVDLHLGKV